MNIQDLTKQIPVEGEISLEGIDFITNGDQYLTFRLGRENYGVDILSVKEIRGWEKPTLIPDAPTYLKGVINIRGIIIPIIDLRLRFQIGEASYLPTTVVIVLSVDHGDSSRMMGFVVDAVSDVLDAEESEIKKAPIVGNGIEANAVKGLVNVGDNLVTILNTEQLISLKEDVHA